MAYSAAAAEDGGQAEARRPLDRQGEGQARAHVGSLLSLPLSREMVDDRDRLSRIASASVHLGWSGGTLLSAWMESY